MWWRFGKFINYYYQAFTIYDIHSPLLYRICRSMLKRRFVRIPKKLKKARKRLAQNQEIVKITDFGAGSQKNGPIALPVNKILAKASSRRRKCERLFRLVHLLKPKRILELGTNLGLSAAYLAVAHPATEVFTLEGDPELVKIAKDLHRSLDITNITIIEGRFQDTLNDVLSKHGPFDLVFMDGHHQYEPTMEYFHRVTSNQESDWIICMDDIYWSMEMFQAWNETSQHNLVDASIDWFEFGLLIHNHKLLEKISFKILPYRYKPWRFGLFV